MPLVRTTLSAAVAGTFALISLPADAAGLGRLTVQSALGQPLRAQVEVTSLTEEEAGSLKARLASPEAFNEAGLEFNAALTGLRFEIQQGEGSRPVVKIRSQRPINEPFIDLLVELNWASGKFVREYTFLLDPPELQIGKNSLAPAAPVAPAASTAAPSVAATAAVTAANSAAPAPVATQAPQVATSAVQGAQRSLQAAREAAEKNRLERLEKARAQAAFGTETPKIENRPAAVSQAAAGQAERRLRPAKPVATLPVPSKPVQAASSTESAGATDAETRRIERGDTLADIAGAALPAGVTLDQAIVAIYKRNPQAFFGSVHQMKAGVELVVPGSAELADTSTAEARAEMRRSNAVFRDYRARLADSTRDASLASDSTPLDSTTGQAAVGQIGDSQADNSADKPVGDQLELSKNQQASASTAGGSTGSSSASRTQTAENSIARDIALRNAQERVNELERNVADLQRLLELKNKQLGDAQQLADGSTAASASPSSATGAVIAKVQEAGGSASNRAGQIVGNATDAAVSKANDTAAAITGNATASSSESDTTSLSETDSTSPVTSGATASGSIDTTSSTASNDSTKALVDQASGSATGDTSVSNDSNGQPLATSESTLDSIISQVRSNPYIPAGGAVLALLLGVFAWKRRKKDDTEDSFEDTLGGDDAFAANSLFGTTGGQDVDTNNSLFNSAAIDGVSSVDVHSTEVDPIAEAEVYIAYGREAQAEEILKEALKRQPERQAIRLKLMEIYAGRKDATAYSSLAREMYDQAGGRNEEWPKVITMGLAIDPDNPLYTGDAEAPARPMARATNNQDDSGGSSSGIAAAAAGAAGAAGLVSALSSDNDTVTQSPSTLVASAEATLPMDLENELAGDTQFGSVADKLVGDTQVQMPDTLAKVDEELSALDFDLDTTGGLNVPSISAEGALSLDSQMLDTDLGLMDDLAGPETTTLNELGVDIPSIDTLSGPTAVDTSDVDLSSIGLDLTPSAEQATATVAGNDSARWQEMATKLDLASAYEEIGDREGARELLEEVLKGGDSSQQQKAQAMLSKIS